MHVRRNPLGVSASSTRAIPPLTSSELFLPKGREGGRQEVEWSGGIFASGGGGGTGEVSPLVPFASPPLGNEHFPPLAADTDGKRKVFFSPGLCCVKAFL